MRRPFGCLSHSSLDLLEDGEELGSCDLRCVGHGLTQTCVFISS